MQTSPIAPRALPLVGKIVRELPKHSFGVSAPVVGFRSQLTIALGRKLLVTTLLPSALTSTSEAVASGTFLSAPGPGKATLLQPGGGGATRTSATATEPETHEVCASAPVVSLRV